MAILSIKLFPLSLDDIDRSLSDIKENIVSLQNDIDCKFIALPSDGKVYVIKDGEYAEATILDMTASWQPRIDSNEIVLAVDEDMTAYQLTGVNVVVNS